MFNLNDIREIVSQTSVQTLTLYLNVDNAVLENQADNPAWKIWLKDALREIRESLPKEQKSMWEQIETQVGAYLNDYTPHSKSLILFSGPDLSAAQAYELPFSITNQISFGSPKVLPLLWAIDEYEPYIVALVDQEEARFFSSYLGEIGFQDSVERSEDVSEWREFTIMSNPGPGIDHGAVHGGSGRDDFEKRMDAQRQHLYHDVVAHIETLMQKYNADRLILGGAEASAHAVFNSLPDKIKSSVAGLLPIPLRDTPPEIFEHILPTAQEFERKRELELVNQVIDFAKAGGRGAIGYQNVVDAMQMQRVELLIMSWPAADEPSVTDLALRALSLNSKIELVHAEAADRLNEEGGVCARLYYAL
jgi:hypothetical protein